MPAVVVDSNVIYAARMERDQWHDQAATIVRAMDVGELPRGLVTNYALPEILNPLEKRAGHEAAVETLSFLTRSRGFRIRHLTETDFDRGRGLYRQTPGVELPDTVTVAFIRRTDSEYIYSFDDDFDRVEGITRLTTADDPFA